MRATANRKLVQGYAIQVIGRGRKAIYVPNIFICIV